MHGRFLGLAGLHARNLSIGAYVFLLLWLLCSVGAYVCLIVFDLVLVNPLIPARYIINGFF
jgi:hypothetical protein